jgi:hypothetical protein
MLRRTTDVIQVVGYDPSLRNWGIARGTLNTVDGSIYIPNVSVNQPSLSKGKQVRQNSLDLESAEQLTRMALDAAKGAQAVFVEVPVGSQSARAMASYGICVGILGALRASGIPFFLVTPEEVKLATGLSAKASKADMIDWATTRHPEANWPYQTQLGVTSIIAGKAEHQADACAAIHAGINSQPFKQLLALMNPGQST